MSAFVDANIIVKAFTENSDKEKCREILSGEFVTDMLCLLEAQKSIARIKGNREHAAKSLLSLFGLRCTVVNIDKMLLSYSLKLYPKNNLDVFDCLHYTTAILHNCSEFVSYDKDFDNLAIKRTEP